MRRQQVLLLLGLVLVAVNLRFALTSVGPLIDDLRADLGLSGTSVGLLTTAPLLALGLVSPLAPRLADRFGAEHVVLACLLTIFAGVALRWLHPVVLLFAGTIVAGCAIAIGNVLVPGIVKQRFADRAALMTGFYSIGLSGGAALAAGLTVPIESWVGGSWRLALALWALPALIAMLVWWPQLRQREARQLAAARADVARRARSGAAGVPLDVAGLGAAGSGGTGSFAAAGDARGGRISLWHDRRAWSVTLFMGFQSLIFYTAGAWLPEILRAQSDVSAATAGGLLSLMMVLGIPIGFATATLASRLRDQRPLAAVAATFPALGWIGLLLAPGTATALWVVLLGIGAGVGFTLVLTLFVLRARDVPHTAALSGMAQSAGYTFAALGPLAIGALHDVTGGWTLPLIVLGCLALPELLAALAAARPGFVGGKRRPAASLPGRELADAPARAAGETARAAA